MVISFSLLYKILD